MTPGLIERRVYCLPDHNIRVDEVWDLRVPGCPLILHPEARKDASKIAYYRHIYHMTQQQYQYHMSNNWSLLS